MKQHNYTYKTYIWKILYKNVSFYWYFCIYLEVGGGIIVVVFYMFQQMSIMFCYLYSVDMGKHKI